MRSTFQQLPARLARRLSRLLPIPRLRLKAEHWIYLHLEDCEPELKNLISLLPPPSQRRTAIDIGANFGFYSLELQKYFDSTYAFEINPDVARELAGLSQSIVVIAEGLSSQQGFTTLYIPVVANNSLTGWASLHKENLPDAEHHIEVKVPINTLDHYQLTEVDFIKIDVEGHEKQVLRGAHETLVKNSPVLLIEVKEQNRLWVVDYLNELGYGHVVYPFQALHGYHENHVFVKIDQSKTREHL